MIQLKTFWVLVVLLSLSACDTDQGRTTSNASGTAGEAIALDTANSQSAASDCIDADHDGYGENCKSGPDCDDTDPFHTDVCPTCTVKIIPGILGWLIGDKEQTRTLFIIGKSGSDFNDTTVIKWESSAIEVVSRHVFFKRFMLMKAKFNGTNLEKADYRVLVGNCEGKITWAFDKAQHCITSNCLDKIVACKGDTECNSWLSCIEECGKNDMLCQTICGAFYQSSKINAFLQCGLDNGCIKIDFSSLPQCKVPETKPVEVGNIDGFWWVSAIQGSDYVLYDGCQRFIFKELSATEISAENSTLVTYKGETRVCKNVGTFTRTTDGYLKLVYDNYAGYYEQYYPVYQSANVIAMHVCSVDTANNAHDYGTLILTRVPLDSLDSAEMAGLETALKNFFQTTLGDFTLIRTTDCPNQAVSGSN